MPSIAQPPAVVRPALTGTGFLSPTGPMPAVAFGAEAPPPALTIRRVGSVQYLGLNEPGNRNLMSRSIMNALGSALDAAEKDKTLTHLVLESNVEKYFCTGADLKAQTNRVKDVADNLIYLPKALRKTVATVLGFKSARRYALDGQALYQKLANCSKVTVAQVNGYAIGGGVELALACDYIVAGEKAQFVLPETKFGIFPDWGATERLPQKIGRTMAKFMILEGGKMGDKGIAGPATLTAAEAKQIGLVDELAPGSDLAPTLDAAMAQGKFQAKVKRPTAKAEMLKVDEATKTRLSGTRFEAIYGRYQTATLQELMNNELQGLYPPTLKLTLRRINNAPKVGTLQMHKDLITMLIYHGRVSSKKRKPKAE